MDSALDIFKDTKSIGQDLPEPNQRPVSLQKAINSLPYHMQSAMTVNLQKELRSADLGPLRMVSLSDVFTVLAKQEYITYEIMQSNGVEEATDFQHRWDELHIGTDAAAVFNPNGDFASESESDRAVKDNTVGFVGTKNIIRWIAQSLAQNSPVRSTNAVQSEIEMSLIRIKNKINSMLISNTEVKMENTANLPQPGGFITRSTSYNLATSGDLTNALIQGRVDAIANPTSTEGKTYNVNLVALCHPGQLAKIEDLMIARYPGQAFPDQAELEGMLKRSLPFLNVAPYQMMVYKPRPGNPILFIAEPNLPSGYCVFFEPKLPHLAKLRLLGSLGPWAIERPTEDLKTITYIFDNFTLVDPDVTSRAVLSGLNN